MKKLILTGTALLAFAAASFAQSNQATLSQVGTNNGSTQNQTGSALTSTVTQGAAPDATTVNTFNKSLTDQTGKFHSVSVNQLDNADYNQAVVTQRGSGPNVTDGHKATITQRTNSGGATGLRAATFGTDATAGKGNYANVEQSSTANEAEITQSGNSSSNFGKILQTGSSNSSGAGAPGATSIKQTDNSTGNAALIEQPGNENSGQISQITNSSQNEAIIRQVSTDNTATIDQNFQSSLNTARIDQSGGASTASINQEVNAIENQARLIQVGAGNAGSIEQKTTSGGTGTGNVADLYQQGDNNSQTSIEQNNTSYGNKAYLNQYGNNNGETRIAQSTTSYNNTARIDQGGDGQGQFPTARPGDQFGAYTPVNNGKAIIEQNDNSHDNTARIGQSGNGHDARIYQNGTVDRSEAFIDQFPAASGNNTGLIKQTNSTLSSARITQNQNTFPGSAGTGNNSAEVYQGGATYGLSSGNVTTVVQENGGNRSYNEQVGTDNLMDIKQFGNGNLVTGPAGIYRAAGIAHQEGSTNKAYITQTANGGVANTASLYQNGSNNTATITQNGGVMP